MGAVEDRGARRDLVDTVDEDDTPATESFHDGAVVNDFMIDVKRSAVDFQSPFEAVDGHVDAGAEAARVGKDDLHFCTSPPARPALATLLVGGMGAAEPFRTLPQ